MNTNELLKIIKSIAPLFGTKQKIFYPRYKPEPYSKERCCFDNVLEKASRDGGGRIFGWIFFYEESPFGSYLMANHHGVWNSPNSGDSNELDLVDITPSQKGALFKNSERIIFLGDMTANPLETEIGEFSLPNRYFALDDSDLLINYLEQLSKFEQLELKLKMINLQTH